MQFEIPPEVMKEAMRAFNGAAYEASSTAHASSACLAAAVEVLRPHLFAAWSERLTSDEAVEALAPVMFDLAVARSWPKGISQAPPTWADAIDEKDRASIRADVICLLSELRAAALTSVSGKDGANG